MESKTRKLVKVQRAINQSYFILSRAFTLLICLIRFSNWKFTASEVYFRFTLPDFCSPTFQARISVCMQNTVSCPTFFCETFPLKGFSSPSAVSNAMQSRLLFYLPLLHRIKFAFIAGRE